MNQLSFFMPMIPPTTTHQMQRTGIRNGKPFRYESPELADAREKLTSHLAQHKPAEELKGPLQLIAKWCFPLVEKKQNGQYKPTKPDTDNLQKLLKDCMTVVGFWRDDAQVASEIAEKFWADIPGIYIEVRELEGGHVKR